MRAVRSPAASASATSPSLRSGRLIPEAMNHETSAASIATIASSARSRPQTERARASIDAAGYVTRTAPSVVFSWMIGAAT